MMVAVDERRRRSVRRYQAWPAHERHFRSNPVPSSAAHSSVRLAPIVLKRPGWRAAGLAGQKLQVIGEQPAVAGIMVRSQIVKANGEPVNVDYMMRRNGDSWLISDIYLDGAISEVATR
jgi:hypothetical protein